MSLIDRYLLGMLLGALTLVAASLGGAIWMTQSLRFLDLAVNGGAPFSAFLTLVFLTLPAFLVVILPIAVVIVVTWVYNRLTHDSEAIVIQATGHSPWRLARPAIILGVATGITVFGLAGFTAPVAQREMKDLRALMRTQYASVLVREGVFTALEGGTTVYIRERASNGELRGLLIHEQPPGEPPVTVIAQRGVLIQGDNGPRALVFDGSRQQLDAATGEIERLDFDRYAFDLRVIEPTMGVRWLEPSERTLPELFAPPANAEDQANRSAFRAEAHARLAAPLLCLGLALLPVAILLSGEFNRRGQGRRVLICVGGAALAQAAVLAAPNLAREYTMLTPLIYLANAAPLAAAAWLLTATGRERPNQRPLAPPAEASA